LMFDVFHHIPDVKSFLNDAHRCLKPGGKIIMIEPANTAFGRFIFTHFHHEPFDPKANWKFESTGPLSSANGALPWIVFVRDKIKFLNEFPDFTISQLNYHTPFAYLLSGGLTFKQLMPTFCYKAIRGLEFLLTPIQRYLGMFMTIEVTKNK